MGEQQMGAERQVRRFRASRGTTVQSGRRPRWIDGWISLCTTAVQLGMMCGWIQIGLIEGWVLDKSCYQGPIMFDTWINWGDMVGS